MQLNELEAELEMSANVTRIRSCPLDIYVIEDWIEAQNSNDCLYWQLPGKALTCRANHVHQPLDVAGFHNHSRNDNSHQSVGIAKIQPRTV
jgi:hypothetical protein